MRILIATVQVPFVRGGAEVLAEGLRDALTAAGHEAEIAAVPFRPGPPELVARQMLACRLLDLSEFLGNRVDRVIALKFPAYLIPHPDKVVWLLHQHRSAYDLWDRDPGSDLIHRPLGAAVRDAIHQADGQYLPEGRAVYTIAQTVSRRLRLFNGLDSTPLYHPPRDAERFTCGAAEDYFYFPSRLNPAKGQALVLQALAHTWHPVRVRFSGPPEHPAYFQKLRVLAARCGVEDRVEWLGPVGEEEKRRLYAGCLGVLFPPVEEDYGYITLEAMLAAKPVVTTTDSGGPLEFVVPGETGLVAEPTAEAMADALDRLWADRRRAREWGQAGRARYEALDIRWDHVVARLAA